MVHNGVEYGIMKFHPEELNIYRGCLWDKYTKEGDEVSRWDPENYQYDIDVSEVAELWRRGSVVGSWLLDLTADILRVEKPKGRWGSIRLW